MYWGKERSNLASFFNLNYEILEVLKQGDPVKHHPVFWPPPLWIRILRLHTCLLQLAKQNDSNC